MPETSDVKWIDAPPMRTGKGDKGKWAAALAPLMERPGTWAEIESRDTKTHSGQWAHRTARNLKHSPLRFPAGTASTDWEFTARHLKDEGRSALYGRYLGSTNGHS